jgi:hypothetical protein
MKTTNEEAAVLVTRAIEQIPNLTRFGVGLGHAGDAIRSEQGVKGVQRETVKSQGELKNSLEAVAVCAEWIKQQQAIKTINTRHSSYGYKHMVEEWCEKRHDPHYISNGCFIAAAVGLGFKFKINAESPNVVFNFSEKSLKSTGVLEVVAQ